MMEYAYSYIVLLKINLLVYLKSKKMKLKRTSVFRKFKITIIFFYFFLNFNSFSYAHMKGTFSSEQKAAKKSLELGCIGTHKNQDKWLPCENEKELHKYLRK